MKSKIGVCDRCGRGAGGPGVRLLWDNMVRKQPLMWLCPWCYHVAQTARRGGLDPEEYGKRLEEVKRCECCNVPLEDATVSGVGRGIGRLADIPLKGKLRGILCWRCYIVMRYLKGSQITALKVFNYLNMRNYQEVVK